MDVTFTFGLPPVPDCFSKLLVSDCESPSAVPNQPWREAERLRELKDVMLKSLAQESVPETPFAANGEPTDLSDITLVENTENRPGGECVVNGEDDGCDQENEESPSEVESSPNPQPGTDSFGRLNTSLSRLKREMVDLRHLDMSLFCQLLSLNEAIQDFKMSINDRYSEYTGSEYTCSEYTGSEYSFGGMGSRTGSLSSLINDENDWSGDLRLNQDDPNSPLSMGEQGQGRRSGGGGDGVDLAASTSSLLQQITALTKKAKADF